MGFWIIMEGYFLFKHQEKEYIIICGSSIIGVKNLKLDGILFRLAFGIICKRMAIKGTDVENITRKSFCTFSVMVATQI